MRGVRTGGCTCGSVRYALKGEPFRTGVCHCADRRNESGSVFVVYAQWRMATSRSLGKLKRTMDAAFVRHAGQGSSKLILNLMR